MVRNKGSELTDLAAAPFEFDCSCMPAKDMIVSTLIVVSVIGAWPATPVLGFRLSDVDFWGEPPPTVVP